MIGIMFSILFMPVPFGFLDRYISVLLEVLLMCAMCRVIWLGLVLLRLSGIVIELQWMFLKLGYDFYVSA